MGIKTLVPAASSSPLGGDYTGGGGLLCRCRDKRHCSLLLWGGDIGTRSHRCNLPLSRPPPPPPPQLRLCHYDEQKEEEEESKDNSEEASKAHEKKEGTVASNTSQRRYDIF